ncbi:hypothetical protein ACFL0T_03410 [Candidatus Omnitrophota bacterium]
MSNQKPVTRNQKIADTRKTDLIIYRKKARLLTDLVSGNWQLVTKSNA